jgi:membrane protease YdiL (CAAX protease family)
MVEIIGLLAISWLLVWLFEKGNLSVLGLRPTKSRLKYSTILFIITGFCCSTGFLMRMYFAKEQFILNPNLNSTLIVKGIWLTLKSVLFEELLCRGVLLYILIKKLGQKWAILISAIIFGALHWNNMGMLGDIKQMAIIFFWPFAFGLVFAYAYAKSFSLYLPIAMHFGWNLAQNFIFPERISGDTLFISAVQPIVTVSYFVFFTMLLLPKISAIVIDYLIIKSYRHIEQPK